MGIAKSLAVEFKRGLGLFDDFSLVLHSRPPFPIVRSFVDYTNTMISSIAWVPQGVAQQEPQKYEMTDDEFRRIQDIAQQELADARQALIKAQEKERADDGTAVQIDG